MAKLCLVNASTYRAGANNIGDVVDIFEDSWAPGPAEVTAFTIVSVLGYTKNQVETLLQSKLPAELSSTPTPETEARIVVPKHRWRVTDISAPTLEGKVSCNVIVEALGP